MFENYCNLVLLVNFIVDDFVNIKNVKVIVLDKSKIEELGMNLFLLVNKGLIYEVRVVVFEYNGNFDLDEKIVFVGKGIIFDIGGVNIKGYYMEGMKYDMFGFVIVVYVLKFLVEFNVKKNVVVVMCIIDNRINGDVLLFENVYKLMFGLFVEVIDIDVEGRLVLVDGLFYGVKVFKVICLVDVVILIGVILSVLGKIYFGVWFIDESNWVIFEKVVKIVKEKVWRMFLYEDFYKFNKVSIVVDLNNYNNDELFDLNIVVMFLK